MSLMPLTIIRELELKRFGYDVTPFGPYYQAFPDGRSLALYADDHAGAFARDRVITSVGYCYFDREGSVDERLDVPARDVVDGDPGRASPRERKAECRTS